MRILIPTVGTRGDVQIYLALAQGLVAAGHEPLVASHPVHAGLAAEFGVDFAPIGPDVDMAAVAADIRSRSKVWLLGMIRTMQFALDVLDRSHDDLRRLVAGRDLVVASHSAAGALEAEQAGVPFASVTIFPQAVPTAPHPDRSRLKKLTDGVAGAVMGGVMTRPFNKLRKRHGAPPLGPLGITSPRLNLLPMSPAVAPPDPRWEPQHRVTGYWNPVPEPVIPSAALAEFLSGDGPVVALTLGAMSGSAGTATLLDAVLAAGARCVVQGWTPPAGDDRIMAIGAISYGWLFPRVDAAIHHGGLGTTGWGFTAGVPALVVPHILDQFYWGQRVHELGCGPASVSVKKLTPTTAAAAVADLVQNRRYRQEAAALGERVRADDGVATTVALLEAEFG